MGFGQIRAHGPQVRGSRLRFKGVAAPLSKPVAAISQGVEAPTPRPSEPHVLLDQIDLHTAGWNPGCMLDIHTRRIRVQERILGGSAAKHRLGAGRHLYPYGGGYPQEDPYIPT